MTETATELAVGTHVRIRTGTLTAGFGGRTGVIIATDPHHPWLRYQVRIDDAEKLAWRDGGGGPFWFGPLELEAVEQEPR